MSTKHFLRTTMAMALVAGSSLVAPSVHAAAVSATMQIWDRTEPGAFLNFTGNDYVQTAVTPAHNDFTFGSTASNLSYNDTLRGGTSFAVSNIDDTFKQPNTNAGVNGNGTASSSFQWTMNWESTGEGTAHVLFDYQSAAQMVNLGAGETAGVSSALSVSVGGQNLANPWFWVNGTQYGVNSLVDVVSLFATQNDSLSDVKTLDLAFEVFAASKGDITLTLSSQAFATAAVPVPAPLWLLGSGLLGLLGLRRKAS